MEQRLERLTSAAINLKRDQPLRTMTISTLSTDPSKAKLDALLVATPKFEPSSPPWKRLPAALGRLCGEAAKESSFSGKEDSVQTLPTLGRIAPRWLALAGLGKSDSENNQKLLRLFQSIPDNCRGAHYKSVVALAAADKVVGVAAGEVHGVIYHREVGTNGFGYDPLFFYPPFGTTFGNVPSEKKHLVSHRAQALRKAKDILSIYLKEAAARR